MKCHEHSDYILVRVKVKQTLFNETHFKRENVTFFFFVAYQMSQFYVHEGLLPTSTGTLGFIHSVTHTSNRNVSHNHQYHKLNFPHMAMKILRQTPSDVHYIHSPQ